MNSRPSNSPPSGPPTNSRRIRAMAIAAALTTNARIRLVSGRDFWTTEPVGDIVPSIALADGPHGVRKQRGENDHASLAAAEPATCFPTASALASSWDPGLLEAVGAALGTEARALGVSMLLGPGLNLKRHPCGGRNFEYFSEDPLLSGTLAAAMVRGIQSRGVAACPKHFAVNNQETRRMVIDAVVDPRTLRELYLRGFERVVRTAEPGALMTAYNQVNGTFASDSAFLLRDVLRGQWGFDGLVLSDWSGTNDRVAGLRAGLDLEMPGGARAFDREVAAAVAEGSLDEADLIEAAAHVIEAALRYPAAPRPADLEAHHALARQAAAAGTVLLTNRGTLPLGDGGLAVIGAFAHRPRFQGAGSSQVTPTRVDTLLDSLREERSVVYAPGYDPETGETTPALLAEAAARAGRADQVVLVLGLPPSAESEALDRTDWSLPPAMAQLVEVVLDAHPDAAVILVNGAPVDLPWAERPGALVEAYLAGQAGGSGLADVLLGRTDPGGRLAESFPVALEDLPADQYFPGGLRQVEYRETFHVGYRFHDTAGVPARFPFGHGLSYTSFDYGPPEVADATVRVTVTNTGDRAGSEVVQVYAGLPGSVVTRPAQQLVAFAKIWLEPGQARRVELPVDLGELRVWDTAADGWQLEPGDYVLSVGASSADIRGTALLPVASRDRVTPSAAKPGPIATDEEFAALLGLPLPVTPGSRPFTRTSTLADLRTAPLGRLVLRGFHAVVDRTLPPEDKEATDGIRQAFLDGMPLRALVSLSAGRLSMRSVDRLVAVLNASSGGRTRR